MTDIRAEDPVPSNWAVFHMAWPLTLRAVMLHGVLVIDALLVAPLGEGALASMGLATAVAGLLTGTLFAFSNATQIRIAQAFGSGRATALKTVFLCGLIINLAVAALGVAVVLLGGEAILGLVSQEPDIAAEALRYLWVFLVVVMAEAVAECLSGHFNGCGNTRLPFYSYLLAIPTNVAVSVLFIHGHLGLPELGVTGAAVGTAAGAILRAAFLGLAFHRGSSASMRAPGWTQGGFGPALRAHLLFALPIAATFVSATWASSACMLIYARLPINEFAAMTLILPWVNVAGIVGMAWAQAVGILVAQLLGRRTSAAALDAFLTAAWRMAFVAAAAVALIYLGVCLASGRLYDDLQGETRATLWAFLPVLLLLPFPKGSNAICGQTLRAGGDTVYVMHIFVWSQWLFRVPATAAMVLLLELPAPWVFSLLLVEELVKLPPFHLRLLAGHWKQGMPD